jgi:ABC-type uncharacterized transport system involved in gliding motility auxiliary subunit
MKIHIFQDVSGAAFVPNDCERFYFQNKGCTHCCYTQVIEHPRPEAQDLLHDKLSSLFLLSSNSKYLGRGLCSSADDMNPQLPSTAKEQHMSKTPLYFF